MSDTKLNTFTSASKIDSSVAQQLSKREKLFIITEVPLKDDELYALYSIETDICIYTKYQSNYTVDELLQTCKILVVDLSQEENFKWLEKQVDELKEEKTKYAESRKVLRVADDTKLSAEKVDLIKNLLSVEYVVKKLPTKSETIPKYSWDVYVYQACSNALAKSDLFEKEIKPIVESWFKKNFKCCL